MGLVDFLKKILRESSGDVRPTLDLHGLSVKEALKETQAFIEASFQAGVPAVRIIYGKGRGSPEGRGILREVIPRWCSKEGEKWVEGFQREVDRGGADGSLIVFLRKTQTP